MMLLARAARGSAAGPHLPERPRGTVRYARYLRRACEPHRIPRSTASTSADAPWHSRGTTGRQKECRSRRSQSGSVGRPQPSRRISSTPTGEKARAVKARYQGVCRGCGAPTAARGGKGDAYQYCKRCRPGAIAPTRTRAWVRDAMRTWQALYGSPPSSTDWSRTHARRRGGEALKRWRDRDWPAPSTVIDLYGTWAAARSDAFPDD